MARLEQGENCGLRRLFELAGEVDVPARLALRDLKRIARLGWNAAARHGVARIHECHSVTRPAAALEPDRRNWSRSAHSRTAPPPRKPEKTARAHIAEFLLGDVDSLLSAASEASAWRQGILPARACQPCNSANDGQCCGLFEEMANRRGGCFRPSMRFPSRDASARNAGATASGCSRMPRTPWLVNGPRLPPGPRPAVS